MAVRRAMIESGEGFTPPDDLPAEIDNRPDRFTAVFTARGITRSNVTWQIDGKVLAITIGRGGGSERDNGRRREADAIATLWRREFRLGFAPDPDAVTAVVDGDRITVAVSRRA